MSRHESVLVFCGFRPGAHPEYVEQAGRLGTLIAERSWSMVYGGGSGGVMGAVAGHYETKIKAVLAEKVTTTTTSAESAAVPVLITVIPKCMLPADISGPMLGANVFSVDTMAERKRIMFQKSTIIIALPGGIGTLDELFESLTLHQLGAFSKKIGLLNTRGFFNPLLALLQHQVEEGFLGKEVVEEYIVVGETPEALMAKLDAFTVAPPALVLKWTPGNEF